MNDYHIVSVKGVLRHGGAVLLRQNERGEWELLGGRLEPTDETLEARLHQEFLEESGITVEVSKGLEPWTYQIGSRRVLIVPFACSPVRIPDTLYDQDGGQLAWIREEQVPILRMPQGYIDTIEGNTPRASVSPGIDAPFLEPDTFATSILVTQSDQYSITEPLSIESEPRKAALAVAASGGFSNVTFAACRLLPNRRLIIEYKVAAIDNS